MPIFVDGVEMTEVWADGVEQTEVWADGVQVFAAGGGSGTPATVTNGIGVGNTVHGFSDAPSLNGTGSFGSILPTVFNGVTIRAAYTLHVSGFTDHLYVALDGDLTGQLPFWTSIFFVLPSATFLTADANPAAYDATDDVTVWHWPAVGTGLFNNGVGTTDIILTV